MNDGLNSIVNYIVDEGEKVKAKYLEEQTGPVDYVAIFCKDEDEKKKLLDLVSALGTVAQETPTGPNIKLINPIVTNSGAVRLIKIRNVDSIKRQRGAPDFRVEDYHSFKQKYLGKKNINLIDRKSFEMIEIWDPQADVLVYFPNIPLTKQLGIKTD